MRILFAFLFLFSAEVTSAQHLLRLMSPDGSEGILIEQGQTIGYQLKLDTNFYGGEITEIKDSSLVIDKKEISPKDISLITMKANWKKTVLWGVVILAAEGALFGAKAITGDDNEFLGKAIFYSFVPAVAAGTFLIVRGIIKRKKGDKYPIGEEWEIGIVPPEKK